MRALCNAMQVGPRVFAEGLLVASVGTRGKRLGLWASLKMHFSCDSVVTPPTRILMYGLYTAVLCAGLLRSHEKIIIFRGALIIL